MRRNLFYPHPVLLFNQVDRLDDKFSQTSLGLYPPREKEEESSPTPKQSSSRKCPVNNYNIYRPLPLAHSPLPPYSF
uniref:Uncharacterized protein n=1 Tax=Ditylenchus dipsaci TaxID=166011 RepID=A0A915EE15_9BILA